MVVIFLRDAVQCRAAFWWCLATFSGGVVGAAAQISEGVDFHRWPLLTFPTSDGPLRWLEGEAGALTDAPPLWKFLVDSLGQRGAITWSHLWSTTSIWTGLTLDDDLPESVSTEHHGLG